MPGPLTEETLQVMAGAESPAEAKETLTQLYLNPHRPIRTWWNFQQASLATSYLRSSAWKQLAAGKGIHWSGVLGLRGIASGQTAYSGRMALAKGLSPSHILGGIISHYNPAKGQQFEKGGLFGKGGIWERRGLATFLGGTDKLKTSIPPSLRRVFGENLARQGMTQKDILQLIKQTKLSQVWRAENPIEAFDKLSPALKQQFLFKYQTDPNKYGPRQSKIFEKLETNIDKSRSALLSASKGVKRRAFTIRNVARIGRVANAAMWASLMWDVTSFGVESLLTAGSAMAGRMEKALGGISNRTMEFGGNLAPAFFSVGAATERQRALSAIAKTGYRGQGLTGNEGAYQHIGNTW